MRVVALAAVALSPAAFAPFGWPVVDETDPAHGAHALAFEWADPNVNVIGHAYDEVEHTAAGDAVCARMYRHATHTQVLMPLNVPAVLAVAPADADFGDPAGVATIRAFCLEPLDAVALHRGTWHWGPYPLGPEPVRCFNVQGSRYLEDNASVDLPAATGTRVEISAP